MRQVKPMGCNDMVLWTCWARSGIDDERNKRERGRTSRMMLYDVSCSLPGTVYMHGRDLLFH